MIPRAAKGGRSPGPCRPGRRRASGHRCSSTPKLASGHIGRRSSSRRAIGRSKSLKAPGIPASVGGSCVRPLFHRWYQPGNGRYTKPDPIRLLTGANNFLYSRNTYLYAEANPLVLVDLLGLYGTNDCSYYDGRCRECGGDYYCSIAPRACRAFGETPDPDPSADNDYEGWRRCTRQCLQECDANNFDNRRECNPDPCADYGPGNPDPATDGFSDEGHQVCHRICYVYCHFWGTWGGGEPGMQPVFK